MSFKIINNRLIFYFKLVNKQIHIIGGIQCHLKISLRANICRHPYSTLHHASQCSLLMSLVSCSSVRRLVLRLPRRRLLLLPAPARPRHVSGVRLQPLPVCRHQAVRHGRSLGGGAAALHRRRNEAATSQEIRRERCRLVDVTP